MRLLLDSHVALWWLTTDRRLSTDGIDRIADADEVYYSAVTPWELGIKRARGRLTMPDGLVDELNQSGFEPLRISVDHAERAASLPDHHRDPFDRMLVAQAQVEALALVSADRSLAPYQVELIDPT